MSCKKVKIVINGVDFLADLILLGPQGLDVILGMEWLAKQKGFIDCARKSVTLTNHHGTQVTHTAKLPSS